MGNLTDPQTLSALAGVLLALVQLVRLLVLAHRGQPLPVTEGDDTPPQTPPDGPAAALPLGRS